MKSSVHNEPSAPSPWVQRFAHLVSSAGPVLDLAAGRGRNARLFLGLGHPVVAVDRTLDGLLDIADAPGLECIQADLEYGPWPLAGRRFAGIVVTNYLHRPLLPILADSLLPGGMLIYETFAVGNEKYGKPSNPDFLLRPNELIEAFAPRLMIVAYEHGVVETPRPAVVQRIAATVTAAPSP
jgi:SAM-dependent methyltransferase